MRHSPGLLLLLGLLSGTGRGAPNDLVQQGRRVYIAEGCIHCHSQYVRPDTTDEERYGAARTLPDLERQTPPLFGNRRQGPDLMNVGSRRGAEWLRLQLQAPRTVMAGSRMPSYAHLFRPGRNEGEALVAYLLSLKETGS
jgi:cytochrome c oxidase cbb3-type subunit 2